MTLPLCESCGMAMTPKQRSAATTYCIYCTSPVGELKPRETIRAGLVHFFMRSRSIDRANAEKLVDQHLTLMPAWQKAASEAKTVAKAAKPRARRKRKL